MVIPNPIPVSNQTTRMSHDELHVLLRYLLRLTTQSPSNWKITNQSSIVQVTLYCENELQWRTASVDKVVQALRNEWVWHFVTTLPAQLL